MARLIALAGLLLAAATLSRAQQSTDQNLKQAGVCGRCHVISVVEWGISKHAKMGTDCAACHGESKGHVADERNNIKPERLPRGEKIASLCATCHNAGCPKTQKTAGCQSCHHVHALMDPSKPPSTKDTRLETLSGKWREATRRTAEGERLAALAQWEKARDEFRAALELTPGNRRARTRLTVCENHLRREIAGFDLIAGERDASTGLPRFVRAKDPAFEMVLVPGGDVTLGSERFAASKPVHTVAVEPFYLARLEVTQELWTRVMGGNPSAHQGKQYPAAGKLPVEQVSWRDAQAFIGKLNETIPGGAFRLPTEAEWELAARAGTAAAALPSPAPKPAGSGAPNRLGLYDMTGNVWEWCSSLAMPYPFDPTDGREAPEAAGLRVLRGGGFADTSELLDPALRHSDRPESRLKWNGFRIARDVPAP